MAIIAEKNLFIGVNIDSVHVIVSLQFITQKDRWMERLTDIREA
jgi:hypothetical protein